MSDEHEEHFARTIDFELQSDSGMGDVAMILGYDAPPDDDGFWYRDDHGPVHDTDLRQLLVDDICRLQGCVPQWLDEPTGDGWYWIEPTEADKVSQYPWRFAQPRRIEHFTVPIIRIPEIGGGCEDLDGRRVSPVLRRPE